VKRSLRGEDSGKVDFSRKAGGGGSDQEAGHDRGYLHFKIDVFTLDLSRSGLGFYIWSALMNSSPSLLKDRWPSKIGQHRLA
jgi:hypothetical protein